MYVCVSVCVRVCERMCVCNAVSMSAVCVYVCVRVYVCNGEYECVFVWSREHLAESVYMCMCVVCLVCVYASFPARVCANLNARISFECADLFNTTDRKQQPGRGRLPSGRARSASGTQRRSRCPMAASCGLRLHRSRRAVRQ